MITDLVVNRSFNMFRTRTFSRTDTPILADQTSVSYNLTLKPIDRLVIEPSLNSFNLKDVDGNELSAVSSDDTGQDRAISQVHEEHYKTDKLLFS